MASQRAMPVPTILVADSNDESRGVLTRVLRLQGYRVILAEDGFQALEAFTRERIDLALLDALLPVRSGFFVCQELKARPETRHIPVVLVTGLASTDDRIRGIECGTDEFLSRPVRKEELLTRVRSLIRLKRCTDELESTEAVLYSLARSIDSKDPHAAGHSDRLARYCMALGEYLGLPQDQREALQRGSILHDIGKVVVPERVLLKPGPLDPTERRIVQSHPVAGERICSPLGSFRLVLPLIRSHHEHLDGSGYPDGLSAEGIPLTVRILQIVDVYDALTSNRPYRKPLSSPEALAILREETQRGWWDVALLGELEALLRRPRSVCAARAIS